MSLDLNYYYGTEAEQYSFYRVPKTLLTDPRYKGVSIEAKVLYGLLLDRMGLSVKNGWMDADGRVYIYFTQEDAMTFMNCGKDKATRLFRELDKEGIGLIERRKQGQGRPTRIYVKNFILPSEPDLPQPEQAQPPCSPQTAENQQSGQRDNAALLTAEKPQSGTLESSGQDCGISAPNKTDKKKTEWNDTDLSIFPPTPAVSPPVQRRTKRRIGKDEMDSYRELIRENIEYDFLTQERPYDQDMIDGYIELMVETCCSQRESIRIGGEAVPLDVVRSRFLKLTGEHIGYVVDCLRKNTTRINNIRAYMLTALYNAPVTMDQYYTSLVSHDMAQDAADG